MPLLDKYKTKKKTLKEVWECQSNDVSGTIQNWGKFEDDEFISCSQPSPQYKYGRKLISFGCKTKTKSKKFGKHGVAYKKANYKESHWKISLKSLARLSCIGTSWNEHHEAISLIFLSAVFLSGSKIVVPWAKENNESVKFRELCERRKFGKTAVF